MMVYRNVPHLSWGVGAYAQLTRRTKALYLDQMQHRLTLELYHAMHRYRRRYSHLGKPARLRWIGVDFASAEARVLVYIMQQVDEDTWNRTYLGEWPPKRVALSTPRQHGRSYFEDNYPGDMPRWTTGEVETYEDHWPVNNERYKK